MQYSEFIQHIQHSTPEDWIINDEFGTYVYKDNLSITIKREEVDFSDSGRFYEEWTERFPDKKAYKQRFLLCYNQTIVEDFYTVAVDGFRSNIPYPKLPEMTITEAQFKIGQIINSIGGHSFEEYIKRAGISVQ
ncbi:conserved hypothetical protein [Paenibacillus curdlanolyticus YK9]|uniref:Uncharacterized protein n=1 Tax=Paenibacillus curdlanolyticus YK9 TaxID=717606 RepID=E0IBS6_9BACL|nr:hypothetical protein [Paenibacillus curdlanolyticus]EFM10156.1 conserved hypothetical protein [Paenibacillus curdlanolyticus YK9]